MSIEFFTTILTTSMILFVAEIGDKTNLVALSLMINTNKPWTVTAGAFFGLILSTIVGVLIAVFISTLIDPDLFSILSGILFILLGLFSLRELYLKKEVEELEINSNELSRSKIIVKSIALVGLAEFGDKSQLFVIGQAGIHDPIAVFLGAMIGMGLILVLTALIGERLIKSIPKEKIHLIAALMFIIAGVWILVSLN